MPIRPDLCKLAAAPPQWAARHGVSGDGFKPPLGLLAVIFAPLGTSAGIDAQPGSGSVKDLVESPILRLPEEHEVRSDRPDCLTAAG